MSEPIAVEVKTGTRYVVLGRDEEGGWIEAYRVVALSGDVAIREYIQRLNGAPPAKEFVAVPERSWKPRKPTVKLG
jgi:hypothetical protein